MNRQGQPLRVEQCPGARESFREALSHMSEDVQEDCIAQFQVRRNRLQRGEQLRSPDHFRDEGTLSNGAKFYAIKTTQGLRAYGWYSTRDSSTFWISHFAFKDSAKRKKADKQRVQENWDLKEK